MSVKVSVRMDPEVQLSLNESEARALDALAGYSFEAFLEVFYTHLGKVYLEPHANALRTLFSKIRTTVPGALSQLDETRQRLNQIGIRA